MRYLTLLGWIILLISCATTTSTDYTKMVQSWRNASARTLVDRWGIPDAKIVGPTGNIIYMYRTKNYPLYEEPIPTTTAVHVSQDGKPVLMTPSNPSTTVDMQDLSLNCIAAFEVNKQGIITDTQVRGNACYGSRDFATKMSNPNKA